MAVYLTDPTSHQTGGVVENLGDIVIKQAIQWHLADINADKGSWIGLDGDRALPTPGRKDVLVLAGANILANRPYENQYVWRPAGLARLQPGYALLFGVGWWQYQENPGLRTRLFYSYYLKPSPVLHSVRDAYTRDMLARCGANNVVNTGCPTLWNLPDRLEFKSKKDEAVFTLTDYNRDAEKDGEMIRILLEEYSTVHYFPQGTEDEAYLRELLPATVLQQIPILPRTIEAYDALLDSDCVDYVGTRLHGGIRAMQRGRRALILSVDNRATEIARDTRIPVIERRDLTPLRAAIREQLAFDLNINRDGIRRFKTALAEACRRYAAA